MKLAVTGATGMLGTAVLNEAAKRGYETIGLYHRTPASGVTSRTLEIRSLSSVRDVLRSLSPSFIVHAAADVRVDWCEDHPEEAALTNIEGSANVARVAAEIGARLLYVSTDSVFDGIRGDYRETDIASPLNVYARTKLHGEVAVQRELPTAVVARANFYGWGGEHKVGLLSWILKELSHGRSLLGFTDAIFCAAPAHEVAAALIKLLVGESSGIFHVVGPEKISKYDFACRVASQFGYDPNLVTPAKLGDANLRAPRPLNTSLNTDKLQSVLGLKLPGVSEALERLAREVRIRGTSEL